jgi:hypothetical protein
MKKNAERIALFAILFGLTECARVPLPDSRRLLPPYRDERLHDWPGIANDSARQDARARWDAVVKFAPLILQQHPEKTTPEQEQSDFIVGFDFDGNLQTADNKENLNLKKETAYHYPLQATVYYAIAETHSHRFITYFLYHAVDWSSHSNFFRLGITHENDGESLQVVTRKAAAGRPEEIVLLATQAHLTTRFFARSDSKIKSAGWTLQPAPIQFFQIEHAGDKTHPAVRVESGGHGIQGDLSGLAESATSNSYIDFAPSKNGTDGDFWTPGRRQYEYRLAPIHDSLWRFYLESRFLGNGGVLDGGFDYHGDLASYPDVPRFFDSDRLSFFPIWKKDSGIVPFAFDGRLICGPKGRLFFDPAQAYQQKFSVPEDWSTVYSYNPYLPDGAGDIQ